MRISTKLIIAALVPVLMAVGMIAGLLWSYRSVLTLQAEHLSAVQISSELGELNDLARSYMANHEDRPKRQFEAQYDVVLRLVQDQQCDDPEYCLSLDAITSDLERVGALFTRIVASWERQGPAAKQSVKQRAEAHLAAQLFIRSRAMNIEADRLTGSIEQQLRSTQQQLYFFDTLAAILVAALLTVGLLALIRDINVSLKALEEGTSNLAAGRLDYRIGLKGRDELASLGGSIDRMAGELRELTVSREELSAEIEERKIIQERLSQEAGFSAALDEIGQLLHSTLSPDEVIRRALEAGTAALGANAGILMKRQPGRWVIAETHGRYRADDLPASWTDDEAPLNVEAESTRQAVVLNDLGADARLSPEMRDRYGGESIITLPLVVKGTVQGVLSFTRLSGEAFMEADVHFANRLSQSVSQALYNAWEYESEHIIARTLQETLVVVPTRVHGAEFSRAYESATSQVGRVGGDFVDVFEARHHTVAVTIGDVSGKGLDAAVTTSLVRNTLRVHALEALTPDEIFVGTNRVLRQFTSVESFVTAFFGLLDTRSGFLRYACAGHPACVLLSSDGTVERLACADPILGAFDDVAFHEYRYTLSRGQRLVLYSDGVTEARSPEGEFFDISGLERLLVSVAEWPTSEIAPAVLEQLRRFTNGVFRDDAAVLVVEPNRLKEARDDDPQLEFASEDEPASGH